MHVLVQDAAEVVTSMDVQVGEPVRVGDRLWQWSSGPDGGPTGSYSSGLT
jgi:hypothetical protein